MREATDPQFKRLVDGLIGMPERQYRSVSMQIVWAYRYDRTLPDYVWQHVAVLPSLPEWHGIRAFVLETRRTNRIAYLANRDENIKLRRREYMREYMRKKRAKP